MDSIKREQRICHTVQDRVEGLNRTGLVPEVRTETWWAVFRVLRPEKRMMGVVYGIN